MLIEHYVNESTIIRIVERFLWRYSVENKKKIYIARGRLKENIYFDPASVVEDPRISIRRCSQVVLSEIRT